MNEELKSENTACLEFSDSSSLIATIAGLIEDKALNKESKYTKIEELVQYGFDCFSSSLSNYDRGLLYFYSAITHNFYSNYNEQLASAQSAISLLEHTNDTIHLHRSYQKYTYALWLLGRYTDIISPLNRQLELSRELNDAKAEGSTLNNLGLAFRALGDYPTALEYFEQAVAVETINNNTYGLSGVIGNIGTIYHQQGNNEIALEYYQRSLQLKEQFNDSDLLITTLGNIGQIHSASGEYERGLEMLFRSLSLSQESGDTTLKASILAHIGDVYRQMERYDEATDFLHNALDTITQIEGSSRVHSYLARLAELLMHEKYDGYNLIQARSYLLQALSLCKESKEIGQVPQYYQLLCKIEEKEGNYEQAYEYLHQYIETNAALTTNAIEDRLNSMHIKHNLERFQNESKLERLRNVELEETNARLAELNNDISAILGIAANRLRNPLGSIKLSSESLLRRAKTLNYIEIQEFAANLLRSSSYMFAIISDLLEVNALENHKIDAELIPCNVSGIVHFATESQHSAASVKGINLQVTMRDNLPEILIDEQRLREACDRLLSNAIKFSPYYKTVEINVNTSSDNSALQIVIRDHGQGITADDMPKIFNKFQKLTAIPTAGEDSTGLGLPIVKQLVALMKGRIWCESTPGEGAAFIMEFPAL